MCALRIAYVPTTGIQRRVRNMEGFRTETTISITNAPARPTAETLRAASCTQRSGVTRSCYHTVLTVKDEGEGPSAGNTRIKG